MNHCGPGLLPDSVRKSGEGAVIREAETIISTLGEKVSNPFPLGMSAKLEKTGNASI